MEEVWRAVELFLRLHLESSVCLLFFQIFS
jgi:hypothetical protein